MTCNDLFRERERERERESYIQNKLNWSICVCLFNHIFYILIQMNLLVFVIYFTNTGRHTLVISFTLLHVSCGGWHNVWICIWIWIWKECCFPHKITSTLLLHGISDYIHLLYTCNQFFLHSKKLKTKSIRFIKPYHNSPSK